MPTIEPTASAQMVRDWTNADEVDDDDDFIPAAADIAQYEAYELARSSFINAALRVIALIGSGYPVLRADVRGGLSALVGMTESTRDLDIVAVRRVRMRFAGRLLVWIANPEKHAGLAPADFEPATPDKRGAEPPPPEA